MFARHTPTRMRGSGVVQGLKSLVSKLHPQLPLSPKESQRLLTALTGSFRKQLDQAYPRQAKDEDARPKLDIGGTLKPGQHAFHASSVASADKHLASVLTNPLIAKNARPKTSALSYESAKLELEQNPDIDPIAVLEEYQKQGAATIALADLCLRTFQAALLELSDESKQQKLAEAQAGRRALRWLLNSGLEKSDAFIVDQKFRGALVNVLLQEGNEQFLWDWLRTDLQHALPSPRSRGWTGSYSLFRWKDFILRNMISKQAQQIESKSLNNALDMYFKAVDLHLELEQDAPNNHLPLGASADGINRYIFKFRRNRKSWDAKRYDKYIETMSLTEKDPRWVEYKKALLQLTHPKHASPLPFYKSLRGSASARPGSRESKIWSQFSKNREHRPEQARIRNHMYCLLIETARELQHHGHLEGAEWLTSEIRVIFPEQQQWVDKDFEEGLAPPKPSRPAPHPLADRDYQFPYLAIT